MAEERKLATILFADLAGSTGEGSSFVSGDAVNIAARLEQVAELGQILAGERTTAVAGAAFEFGERRTVEAKHKPGEVACRPVVRALSLPRALGVAKGDQGLVARADEGFRALGLDWHAGQTARLAELRKQALG